MFRKISGQEILEKFQWVFGAFLEVLEAIQGHFRDVLKREVFKEDSGRNHRDFQMGSKRSQRISGGLQRRFSGSDGVLEVSRSTREVSCGIRESQVNLRKL